MPAISSRGLGRRTPWSFCAAALFVVGFLVGQPAFAAETPGFRSILTSPAALSNGSPFLLSVSPAAKVTQMKATWMSKDLMFFKGKSQQGSEVWYALTGVDVETTPGDFPLTIEATTADGKPLQATIQIPVGAAKYHTGTLTVAPNFVEPDAATQKEIAADKEVKDRVFAHSADAPEWSGDFAKPVNQPSTDSFGTRRTFNGKLASIHRGMDFRAPSGTPVAAANSGTVVLAQKLFYEGNCVVIDHGLGFTTIYMHFSRIDVAAGQKVRKGEHLGLSGATGRVTGPHLHFAARWQGAYLDPAGLFNLKLAGKP
jgi:murein DD-endopeptidase MepM/ murein hydrolase activator NlpD